MFFCYKIADIYLYGIYRQIKKDIFCLKLIFELDAYRKYVNLNDLLLFLPFYLICDG